MGRSTTFPDLYEVLGATRDAGAEELDAAYRSRARELDPDVSDDPEAEQRFRELSHAYAVLSKPRSRLLYDRLAYRSEGNGGLGPPDEDAGEPKGEVPQSSDDELVGWVFGTEEPELAAPVPRDDRIIRYLAAAALLVSIVFLAAILLG